MSALDYGAASITVLAGLEAVRQRPAMYIGATDQRGVHHLVFELVENAVDEALEGHCQSIEVLLEDGNAVTVQDDGRGIPVDLHPQRQESALQVVLTTLHSGGKFDRDSYRVSGGLHGVGLSCVNALADELEVTVCREGVRYEQFYGKGRPLTEVQRKGFTERQGTRIRFVPDGSIFSETQVDAQVLAARLEELSFLHPGLSLSLIDQRGEEPQEQVFCCEDGLRGLVAQRNLGRKALHTPPIWLKGQLEGSLDVELALQWTSSYNEDLISYVNSIATLQGGSHLDALTSALTRAINQYGLEEGLLDPQRGEDVAGFDIREGLTLALSLHMPDPEFDSQTKSRLSSSWVTRPLEQWAHGAILSYLQGHPQEAAPIVGKAIEASRARMAARRASERAQYVSVDEVASKEVYTKQFGIRSGNWHKSAEWIANDELLAEHAKQCQVSEDAEVLDICCGSGVVGAAFRGRVGKITGLDITPEMVALAKTRLDDVVQANVYDIPFEDERFDLVVNREVLHLLPRPERPVAEVFRVLKPGAQFIVGQILPFSEVDGPWMYRVFKKKQPLIFNMFQEEDFYKLLEGAGFEQITMTEHLLWESIDVWIDTHETSSLHRSEIRRLFYNAPEAVREVHPFEVLPDGRIQDCWRWCIFSAFKPE